MKFPVDFAQSVGVDVGVDFGCGDVGMAEHLLNHTQVRAVCEKMTCERVAKRVRMDVLVDPGAFGRLLDDAPDPFPIEFPAVV